MSLFRKVLLFTLILTVPVNIIGFYWLSKTWNTYHLMDKFDVTLGKQRRLYKVGNVEFKGVINQLKNLFGKGLSSEAQLLIKNKDYKELMSDLPATGMESKNKTYMMMDGTILKGKSRLRGDHVYHWGGINKSWRFRTSKNHVHEGINKFNFIIPKSKDMLSNHMSYKLGKSLGLLAPDSRLLDYSINGVYKGPRVMVEQIDESFLRKNSKMANDIYKGDDIGSKKHFGVDVGLFTHASIWDKAAYNNHYAKESRVPLNEMLRQLSKNEYGMVDLASFAGFSALIDFSSSYHHDQTHNWILYYDHYYEKMYPVVWDTTAWNNRTGSMEYMNIASADILIKLFKNYDFMREKHRQLYLFNKNAKDSFLETLDQEALKSEQLIDKNDGVTSLDRSRLLKVDAKEMVGNFKQKVGKKLNQVSDHFVGPANPQDYEFAVMNSDTLRLSVKGSKMINQIHLRLNHPQENDPSIQTATVSYKQGDQTQEVRIDQQVLQQGQNITVDLELLPRVAEANAYIGAHYVFQQASYDLKLEGLDLNQLESLSLSFFNIDEQTLEVAKVEQIPVVSFESGYSNIISVTNHDQQTWSGEKHLSGFTTVKDDLTILPGTRLLFDEGATLKLLGKVTAIGTAENPIVFDALDSSKPWGALAVKDQRANGSVFKHVIFKNGSGDKGDLYEYTAMFSVHNVMNLLVEDSEFYDTKITDDMVHIIYSDVHFKNSTFVRSLSDAVDIDISTAIMENCRFVDSGNDSVDLMTSDAIVINSRFENSGDKGISIGENSRLLAINNHIEGAEIGMQSKDTSQAYIYNTSFINSNKAVDAYHKNWRYSSGGTIYVDKCVMSGNKDNATVGKKSMVVINDCDIDTLENFNGKDVSKGKIVISAEDLIEPGLDMPFFKNHNHLIQPQSKGFHD